MAEQEQLDLIVRFVGEATPQLGKLRAEMQQLAQIGDGEQMPKLTRQMDQLNRQIKPLTEEFSKAERAGMALGAGISLTVAAVAAIGYGLYEAGSKLREFSQQMIDLNNVARTTGFTAGQIKGVADQMAQFGVGRQAALANIASFSEALADVGRQSSELRNRLMTHARGDEQAMQEFVSRLLGFRDQGDLVGAMNELLRAADAAFANAVKRGLPEIEAADVRKRFLAEFHLTPEMLSIIERLKSVTPEQEAALKRQIELAQQFTKEWEAMNQAVTAIYTGIQTELLGPMGSLTAEINKSGEAWGKAIGALIKSTADDVKMIVRDVQDIWRFLQMRPEDIEERLNRNRAGKYGWEYLRDWWRGEGDAAPQRFMDEVEDNTDEMGGLVIELRRLTDYLLGTTGVAAGGGGGSLGALATQMGGLGGGLGGGGGVAGLATPYGSSVAPGGGGGGGGRAPYGSDVGPGTAPGAGATPAGGGTAASAAPMPASAPAAPAATAPAAAGGGWSALTPYEYNAQSHRSWYANFDFEAGLVPGIGAGAMRQYFDRPSDTNRQYGESAIRPGTAGWDNWINAQVDRAAKSGTGFIEFDNADYAFARNPDAVRQAYGMAASRGLQVLLKNPTPGQIKELGAAKTPDGRFIIGGAVFEQGAMSPGEFAAARAAAGRPDLQATFVRHGGQSVAALKRQVEQVPGTTAQYGPREYGGMSVVARGAALDRAAMDKATAKEIAVDSSGTLTVDVKAPKGTSVSAEGSGVFTKTETNRETAADQEE